MDFVMLARYASHNDDILGYMAAALDRLDKLKNGVQSLRPTSRETGEPHFDLSKLHVMTHPVDFIHLYEQLVGKRQDAGIHLWHTSIWTSNGS